ncbi:MAG: diguanylate cyclase [Desulfurivibrio sp.]|nr:diguanylate cyclase [Desulfurivibrio sp.]
MSSGTRETTESWRLLLVDDSEDDLFLIQDLLADWSGGRSPAVYTAASSEEALAWFAKGQQFDCLLFDYRLGREDGLELLEKARCRGCTTPVILLTGQGDEELAVTAMKAGVADYIPKRRLTPELLQHAVRYAIEMHRAELLRAQAEEALAASEERYRELVTTIPAVVCELAADGTILFVNPAVAEITGYHPEELRGGNWWEILRIDEATRQSVGDPTCRQQEDHTGQHELRIQDRDGGLRVLNWNVTCRFDEGGQLQHLVGVGIDISELIRLREELQQLAITDELTGLLNRRGFMTLAVHQMRLAERQGRDLYLAYIDLDGMKEINDNLGHEQGDKALQLTATVLKDSFRESDVLGRLGGDEFAVLILGGPDYDEQALRHRLAAGLASHSRQYDFSLAFSIGITRRAVGDTMELEALLKQADGVMYKEKEQHKAARS